MSDYIVEYEDAYVIEEKAIKYDENEEEPQLTESHDNLELDDLNLSDEISEDEFEVTADYDKLKLASEVSKRKLENHMNMKSQMDKKTKVDLKLKVVKREEVVEDFIRNFFTMYKLNKTLDEFIKEFNELSKKGKFNDNYLGPITDVHIKNAKLEEKLKRMEKELDRAKKNAENAKSQWESLRKERDFHKISHKNTNDEKKAISNDISLLKSHHKDFQSKIDDLKIKYEHLCKSKSLMRLELEKIEKDCESKALEINKTQLEIEKIENKAKSHPEIGEKKVKFNQVLRPGEKTPWPKDIRNNLYLMQNYSAMNANPSVSKSIKAHDKPIGCLSVHIKKHVVATGGDDATFKIFNMLTYDELASGVGHNEYISGIDIHPRGLFMATCSGDQTIKLWDLFNMKVKSTFYDHNGTVWSTKFHDTGDFLLTSGDDSSIKLFDLNTLKCRSHYQGHTDAVNKINFQPFTNYFASCSADKSISIWDMRLGLTVQTFYGHLNTVNDVVFNSRGDMLYSCDGDGIIKAWDIRKVSEVATYFHGINVSANCLDVEKANTNLFVGYENGSIGVVNLTNGMIKEPFKAHESSVNAIGINLTNSNIYTVGSDGILNIWQ